MLRVLYWLLSSKYRSIKLHRLCSGDILQFYRCDLFKYVHELQCRFLSAELKPDLLYQLQRWQILKRDRSSVFVRLHRLCSRHICELFWARQLHSLFGRCLRQYWCHLMLELLSWLLSIYSRPTKLHGVCFGDILRFDCSDHFKHMFGLYSWLLSIKRWSR